MDFLTTTKYFVGDEVYIALFQSGYIPLGPCVITNIEINVSNDKTKVSYYLSKDDAFVGCYPEEKIFSNHEDCVQWCSEC